MQSNSFTPQGEGGYWWGVLAQLYDTLPGLEVMTIVCLHFLTGFDVDMARFTFIQSTEVCQLVSVFFTKVIYSCVAVNQCFHWGKECPRLSIMNSSVISSMFLMLVIFA